MTFDRQGQLRPAPRRAVPYMPALTALRAVAALLVFVYHFPPLDAGGLVDVVASQGHVGVTVFFVLSGFLITLRYYPAFERGERGLADYFVRRAARILPLYWVVLTLTHLFGSGSVPFVSRLPEWTLTHALFGASPDDITVPTSWSLTVEECFYASAPLLFLGLAWLRRRVGRVAGAVTLLVGTAVGVAAAGWLVHRLSVALGATDMRFLSDPALLSSYTIFGRFPEFALGSAGALVYLSGRVEAAWHRPGGAFVSGLASVGGGALLVAAQAGMARSGAELGTQWSWNLLAAVASTVVVLALTCPRAWPTRALALGPFVYLGHVSYALYLIQVTPLGNGLLYRVLPGRDGVHLLTLYVGMNLVSALLFELVEQPSRETLLALWRGGSLGSLSPARTGPARAVSLAILFVALAVPHALWAIRSLDPVDEARVERVLGPDSPDVLQVTVPEPGEDGRSHLALPPDWRLGRSGHTRPPRSLLVFADGEAVPFLGAEPPSDADVSAYYTRPRAWNLKLQLEQAADVTVVRHRPAVAAALVWSLLREDLVPLGVPLALLAAAAVWWWKRRVRIWAPRAVLAIAAGLAIAGVVSGSHFDAWAPLVLPLQAMAVFGLWVVGTLPRCRV